MFSAAATGKALTISYYNASGGGRVTMAHIVLWGPPRALIRRHVALRITYDELSYPSVFVPIGDFFMESAPKNDTAESSYFETPYMAFRPSRSWYSFFHMPYRASIRIELVGATDLPQAVQGEVWTQHEDRPWNDATDSFFHSHFAYQPRLRFPWQPAVWSPPGGWRGPGQLVGISMRFSAPPPWVGKFNQTGTFEHVCEGNWEIFMDNTTQLFGNDSSTNIAAAGYQASNHVVVPNPNLTLIRTLTLIGWQVTKLRTMSWSSPAAKTFSGDPPFP